MSDSNEGMGLFRRMARKVAAPARELVGLPARETEARPTEFDKAEMKAMIERKRRNDYVRKRELDMLRRIRREGLSGERAAALTLQSSRIDENEVESRTTQPSMQTSGIKAKIDAIERQMVGVNAGVSSGDLAKAGPATFGLASALAPVGPPPVPPPPILTTTIFDEGEGSSTVPLTNSEHEAGAQVARTPSSNFALIRLPMGERPLGADAHLTTVPLHTWPGGLDDAHGAIDTGLRAGLEVSAAVHDEILDEAVIAFASAEFDACERALQALLGPHGERHDDNETWLVLFDLYRAIGEQEKFEKLAMAYTERFHRPAPQWFSLPKLLGQASSNPHSADRIGGSIGWVCPPVLEDDAVMRLEALSVQLPEPWVMNWNRLVSLDMEGAQRLRKLLHKWASEPLTMRWIGGIRLFTVLQEATPTGLRGIDPIYWMLRMEALRVAHRPDQFDEVAIDYCVTFEVSPPSWENARCRAELLDADISTRALALSVIGEAVTSFMDTVMGDDESGPTSVQLTSVELSGQLAGDLSELLSRLSSQIGDSAVVHISCALLMRVDFMAASDLLNWVNARHVEGREVVFQETHRLVALMFGAMGINAVARVQIRLN